MIPFCIVFLFFVLFSFYSTGLCLWLLSQFSHSECILSNFMLQNTTIFKGDRGYPELGFMLSQNLTQITISLTRFFPMSSCRLSVMAFLLMSVTIFLTLSC